MGLIHRDIKPANIYICRVGLEYDFAKVLDFGLVKRERHDGITSGKGEPVVAGTPGYMAPEVILGNAEIDRGVDIYALGCVAYFLLTGEKVFRAGNQMNLLIQHVKEEPLPPSGRSELQIPCEVDEFVMACLRKNPRDRPASAEELLRMVSNCKTAGLWDQSEAKTWWEAHLPHLATPAKAETSRPN
jgi:serine/threonine-protein kinase